MKEFAHKGENMQASLTRSVPFFEMKDGVPNKSHVWIEPGTYPARTGKHPTHPDTKNGYGKWLYIVVMRDEAEREFGRILETAMSRYEVRLSN